MNERVYDVVSIGGGPAGLMCALTAVGGIPINPPRRFSGLVIDRFDIGQFAKFGKLRLTHRWHLVGPEVVRDLAEEARLAKIDLVANAEATAVDFSGDVKTVETTKGAFKARTVAVATGFFPHGNLMKHHRRVRPMFSPMTMESTVVPKGEGLPVAVLGRGETVLNQARLLRELRADLEVFAVIDGDAPVLQPQPDLAVHHGFIRIEAERAASVVVVLLDANRKEVSRRECRFILVDYNSYTTATQATRFLEGSGLALDRGYVRVDQWGSTGVPGVVAAGNIVTPVSGVLTALSTAFTSGLMLHSRLHEERFGKAPHFFPWLPIEGIEAHPLSGASPERK